MPQLEDVATVVGLSMKAAIAPVQTEVGMLTREFNALRAVVADLQTRAQIPGPAGADGAPGKDGTNGADGKDGATGPMGTFGDSYKDTFTAGTTYARGDLVTDDSAVWICKADTTTDRPGRSGAWKLVWKSVTRR